MVIYSHRLPPVSIGLHISVTRLEVLRKRNDRHLSLIQTVVQKETLSKRCLRQLRSIFLAISFHIPPNRYDLWRYLSFLLLLTYRSPCRSAAARSECREEGTWAEIIATLYGCLNRNSASWSSRSAVDVYWVNLFPRGGVLLAIWHVQSGEREVCKWPVSDSMVYVCLFWATEFCEWIGSQNRILNLRCQELTWLHKQKRAKTKVTY